MRLGWAALAAVLLAGLVMAGGCGVKTRRSATPIPAASAAGVMAAAGESVATPMRPFFAAGLAFMVVGGVLLALGGGVTGAAFMGLGGITTGVGVLFVQYPWVVLPVFLGAALLAGLATWDRIRTRRELSRNTEALAATVQVIQNVPEGGAIKSGLVEMGKDVEERVRAVVDPIKRRLRDEGRIAS